MRRFVLRFVLIAFAAVLFCIEPAGAAQFNVASASDIEDAMDTAQPGDVLVMADGVWSNQSIDFAGYGTSTSPITLRAQTPGGVTLTGQSNVSISGSHLFVDGLNFENGTPGSSSQVIQFRGSLGHATNSRLTNTQIKDYNPADINDRYFWVSLYGQNNRVDHSRFQNQNHSGVTVVAWLEGNAANHVIDANHFVDRPVGNGNGFEMIRLGDSSTSNTNAHITVENNLFERVDGEIEIISNKSSDNTFQYNTFRESAWTLTLRHGHRATVAGNFILGQNKAESGGIRVIGEDHLIINNYIADIDDRADGAISLTAGIENTPANGYQQVKRATIANNTIVNVQGAAVTFDWLLDSTRTLLAEDVTIANNLISSTHAPLFDGQTTSSSTTTSRISMTAPTPRSPWPPASSTPNPTGISRSNAHGSSTTPSSMCKGRASDSLGDRRAQSHADPREAIDRQQPDRFHPRAALGRRDRSGLEMVGQPLSRRRAGHRTHRRDRCDRPSARTGSGRALVPGSRRPGVAARRVAAAVYEADRQCRHTTEPSQQ